MTTAHSINPRAFDAVGGFLGQRFSTNHERRLEVPLLSEESVRLPGAGRIPSSAFFAFLRGRHRWQLLLRPAEPAKLLRTVRAPADWRADVDSVSVL